MRFMYSCIVKDFGHVLYPALIYSIALGWTLMTLIFMDMVLIMNWLELDMQWHAHTYTIVNLYGMHWGGGEQMVLHFERCITEICWN